MRAFDARAEVGEQVESMGAEFLRIDVEDERAESPTATPRRWARTSTARPPSCTPSRPKDVDIIITTALIPGRPAPRLITADMVASMKPG